MTRQVVASTAQSVDTILIVDDDPARAGRLGQTLTLHGYQVLQAPTTSAALELARQHRPPLVLIGVTASGLEPSDLCRRLRSDWRCGNPSIIVLAGRSHAPDAVGLATEADDFVILEPFDSVRVLTRVAATLRRAEEMRASSPLTGLPGNTAIEQELQRRTATGEPMALLYIDLDHFKAYNDHYGFLRGDAVIRGLAEILRTAAEKRPGTFLGHVGGDDFVVVCTPSEAEGVAEDIMSGVEERIPDYYDTEDSARGFIVVEDRRGIPHRYPLVTVSIGIARSFEGQVPDHRALVDAATEMKQYAKSKPGNATAIDRRSEDDTVRGGGSRIHGGKPPRRPKRPRRFLTHRRAIAVPAALLGVSLLGAPAAVAFADTAPPGGVVWTTKVKLENVLITLQPDPLQDVVLHLRFAAKRLMDLSELLLSDNPDPVLVDRITHDLKDHLVAADQGLATVEAQGSENNAPRATRVRNMVAQQADTLAQQVDVLAGLPLPACAPADGRGPAPTAAQTVACGQLQQALVQTSRELRTLAPITPTVLALGDRPLAGEAARTDTRAPGAEPKPGVVTSNAGSATKADQAARTSDDTRAASPSSAPSDSAPSASSTPITTPSPSPTPSASASAAAPSPAPTPSPTPTGTVEGKPKEEPSPTATASQTPAPEPGANGKEKAAARRHGGPQP